MGGNEADIKIEVGVGANEQNIVCELSETDDGYKVTSLCLRVGIETDNAALILKVVMLKVTDEGQAELHVGSNSEYVVVKHCLR